jgi:anti-sigma B factor antagonist
MRAPPTGDGAAAGHDGDVLATAATVGYRTVVAVEGEIDMATAAELNRILAGHVDGGAWELWVDLSKVTFMDSSGLRALLSAQSALAQQDRRLTASCPPGPVRRVLGISGVDTVVEIFPSRASAQRAH